MSNPDDDVIEVLLRQHREVEYLLDLLVEGTTARPETFDALVGMLTLHESAEEQVVHPAVRSLPGGNAVVDARLDEEHEAKHVLADLRELGVDDPGFDELFEKFATAVRHHASYEELYEFPLLRAGRQPEDLRDMAVSVEAAQTVGPTHPHPHAGESALANTVAAPLLGAFDRVLDAVRDFSRAHGH
ncbi:hemerythrin domain-containing protein [Nocardia stercoris]|uniref:Hemerythrin domain-containing protein n=1 Tax=Nocardia stercoris TaxID=2483361 RepID=A0A3M2L0Y1_9NOCA|nr:hemerythrin domain-containing protein [Nocardia stercoris]RMI30390.1 hemerythrin domain-containing protein [Nocardia stercoris]